MLTEYGEYVFNNLDETGRGVFNGLTSDGFYVFGVAAPSSSPLFKKWIYNPFLCTMEYRLATVKIPFRLYVSKPIFGKGITYVWPPLVVN